MGCPKYGLNIKPSKTQILMNKYVTRSDITILNTSIENSQNVNNLVRTFAGDGSLTEEVVRICPRWTVLNNIRRELLQSHEEIRNLLLTIIVIPGITYGRETWTKKTEMGEDRIRMGSARPPCRLWKRWADEIIGSIKIFTHNKSAIRKTQSQRPEKNMHTRCKTSMVYSRKEWCNLA
uniref:Reverse transcriptase domain-containing protein n=1 Tax=Caenorhabditis japonica TaxID=281687 RepID=A0A8R1I870_CAEJA